MSLFPFGQPFQFMAWFLALIELIMGLYALILNVQHSANRHVSAILLLFAVNSFAVGTLSGATTASQALTPSILMAITTPAVQPGLLVVAIALLKPKWLTNRWRWLWWLIYGVAFAPAVLTLSDWRFGTHFWYTGINPTIYTGGFLNMQEFTGGSFAAIVSTVNFAILAGLTILILFYIVTFDKQIARSNRKLAWLLLGAEVVASGVQFGLSRPFGYAVPILIANLVFVFTYAYAGFQQMISERRAQRGSLQVRITALILIVTLPVLIAITLFLGTRAGQVIEQEADDNLRIANQALATSVSMWLDSDVRALQELASQPDIVSMDPQKQKPILEAMANIYPEMYLVSTTDLNGLNLARNDDVAPKDYSDRDWFLQARDGAPLTFQTLVGRTSGQPALVASVPIRNKDGNFVGVAMFATDLDVLAKQVQASSLGEHGITYVVNAQNQVIAHPDPAYSAKLQDLRYYPPVAALRARGSSTSSPTDLTFTDEKGLQWKAYGSILNNNWAVIAQEPEAELLAPIQLIHSVTRSILILGGLLLFIMAWLTIRQGIQPIHKLTETTEAIAAGDLNRVVVVESEDEVGTLARAFNSMTIQIRELVTNLERRVADRTRDLERRAIQLQVTADVAREAAAIRDAEELLEHTVQRISDRFGFYHAGIFLVDEIGEFAVLRAASSEGGQRMLDRGHKLKVGEVGIVGHVAGSGEPRIALDVGADAVFFNNPDLPKTRSEMALPLKARDQVIGVLDVQSPKASAFSEEDIAILQTLADQIALAIDNARLLQESRQALQELETLYTRQVGQAWQKRLTHQNIAYQYDRLGIKSISASKNGNGSITKEKPKEQVIKVPITLRGKSLGSVILRRGEDQPPWSSDEIALIQNTMSQVALALENARLLEDNRRRAQNEQLISQIAAKAQSSLDLETVMKNAVQEIGRALQAEKVQLRLATNSKPLDPNTSLDQAHSPRS